MFSIMKNENWLRSRHFHEIKITHSYHHIGRVFQNNEIVPRRKVMSLFDNSILIPYEQAGRQANVFQTDDCLQFVWKQLCRWFIAKRCSDSSDNVNVASRFVRLHDTFRERYIMANIPTQLITRSRWYCSAILLWCSFFNTSFNWIILFPF